MKYAKNFKFQEELRSANKIKYTMDPYEREKRLLSSKKQRERNKKAKEDYSTCLEQFRKNCSEGPTYPCTSCSRLRFRNGVIGYKPKNYEK